MGLRSTLLLSVVATILFAGLSVQARNQVSPATQVSEAETARFHALIAGDLDTLAGLLSDDLVYVHSGGEVESKARFLERLSARTLKYVSISPSDVVVRASAALGVTYGRSHMAVVSAGQAQEFDIRYTAVYERQDRMWKLRSWQSTRLPPGRQAQ